MSSLHSQGVSAINGISYVAKESFLHLGCVLAAYSTIYIERDSDSMNNG